MKRETFSFILLNQIFIPSQPKEALTCRSNKMLSVEKKYLEARVSHFVTT